MSQNALCFEKVMMPLSVVLPSNAMFCTFTRSDGIFLEDLELLGQMNQHKETAYYQSNRLRY